MVLEKKLPRVVGFTSSLNSWKELRAVGLLRPWNIHQGCLSGPFAFQKIERDTSRRDKPHGFKLLLLAIRPALGWSEWLRSVLPSTLTEEGHMCVLYRRCF